MKTLMMQSLFDQVMKEHFPLGGKHKPLEAVLASLPRHFRIAYIFGIFNSQILRNGFDLWIGNQYMETYNQYVVEVLDEVGTCASREVKKMVLKLPGIAAKINKLEAAFNYQEEEESPRNLKVTEQMDALAEVCDDMGQRYLQLTPCLSADVEALLKKLVHSEEGSGPIFWNESGDVGIESLEGWQSCIPKKDWKDGRSAKLLAETWLPASGLPRAFKVALNREEFLRRLVLHRAYIEKRTPTPGRGPASATDLMAVCENKAGKVIVAVEAKVDEGFDIPLQRWLVSGSTPNSADNRKYRATQICKVLGTSRTKMKKVNYQLLHRTYSAIKTAQEEGAATAVMAVHSFLKGHPGDITGWDDFLRFASVLNPEATPPEPGIPWSAETRDGVRLWLLWVEGKGGKSRKKPSR